MSRLTHLLGGLVVVFAAAAVTADDKSAATPTKIDGTYAIISGERDGKPMPEGDIKNCVVKITADKISGTDKDGKEFLNASYTVEDRKEEGKKACTVRMETAGGKKYMGLAEKTGDGLKLVYHLDGGQPPTDFKTNDKQVMLVLKSTTGK